MTTAVVAGDGAVVVDVVVTAPSRSPWSSRSRRRSRRATSTSAPSATARWRRGHARSRRSTSGAQTSSRRDESRERRAARRAPPRLVLLASRRRSRRGRPTTVLPRPAFPAPATGAGSNTVSFRDRLLDRDRPGPARHGAEAARADDRRQDGTTQHFVFAPELRLRLPELRLAAAHRARRARVRLRAGRLGERGADGVLYVETAHQTYAKSSYGLNGYLSAIDSRSGSSSGAAPRRSRTRTTSSC